MHIRFKVGQLVRSNRLKERGVIVSADSKFTRAESWFSLLPDKSTAKVNPWYLLLLDGSNITAYVPEKDLIPDLSGKPITGPKVETYFDAYGFGMHYNLDNPPNYKATIRLDDDTMIIF